MTWCEMAQTRFVLRQYSERLEWVRASLQSTFYNLQLKARHLQSARARCCVSEHAVRRIKRIAIVLVICFVLAVTLWGAVIRISSGYGAGAAPEVTPTVHPMLAAVLTPAPRPTLGALS